MARITGRVTVKLNGEVLLTKVGSTTINGVGLSGQPNFELASVMGDNGISGYVETPIVASAELTITDRDDVRLDEIARVRENGTVVVEAANGGKVYTMSNATCTRNLKITSGEGDTTLKFEGNHWVESTEAAI
jgi:hypothetical protein